MLLAYADHAAQQEEVIVAIQEENTGSPRLLGRRWVPISSFFKVAKNDSAGALSQHWPVRPTDSRMPNSPASTANSWLVH